MTAQVYYDLREQLDQYSVGFPSTESGVEMKILEKLFSQEEAELYLNLSMMAETSAQVAQRLGRSSDATAALLERMVDRGLIIRLRKKDSAKYAAVPFVVGSFEFQVKTMDTEFAHLFEQYFLEAFGKVSMSTRPPMRTIPVQKSVEHLWPVAPYEDVKKIFESKDRIAVGDCICKVQKGLVGEPCDRPSEVCFQFGSHADFYVERGMSRFVDREEAFRIIDKCEEVGLVPQPFMSQDAGGLCNCCGDCCGILRGIKMDPKPSSRVLTNYYASVDPEACSGCETCQDRCQMEAIAVGADGVSEVNRDRCIGCGLCVTTCPSDAVSLQSKPESEREAPPATARDFIMQLASERGKSLIPLVVTRKAQG